MIKQVQNLKSNIENQIDFSPKGYFIEYPFLIDCCIKDFVDSYQDSFIKKKDRYVLKEKISRNNLSILFNDYLKKNIDRLTENYLGEKNAWIIIADSGVERRNCLQMLESDIDIRLNVIEHILESIFNKFMRQKRCDTKIIYCKHRYLTSSDWEKICKGKIFGRKNTIVLSSKKLKCIKEEIKQDLILSNDENKLIIKEATDWIKENLSY